jgi:hypothetical protein
MIAASIGNTHHFDEDEVFIRLPRRIAGRGEYSFFFFAQRRRDLLAVGRRKEIVVRSV